MKNIIKQGLIIALIFFGTWLVLAQINWRSIFKIKQVSDKTEQKLGELFWDFFKKSEREIKDISVIHSIDSIVTQICVSNDINREKLTIHLLKKDEINAFALPNGHLIIYSGLILSCDNQDELAGVICHEIAHIELNHVMKKLVKEIGLSVLISITTGNNGTEFVKEAARVLSSAAFDRSLEKEADLKAVDYLINTRINPEQFANFLYKLSDTEHKEKQYLTWISTHPNSKERAEYIISYSIGNKVDFKPILSNETWVKMQDTLKDI
jgi:predicted Zn-dependent protease